MCGIAGFVCRGGYSVPYDASFQLEKMADAIRHRGPDDYGSWADAESGVGLLNRRLAVIDLSPAGHQPMISAGGRFVLVFNGEIYNHAELRREIGSNHSGWRGHSDTETLLEAFDAWGIEKTLKKAIGMFAIALWDRSERTLTLARDRFGEKPLYYGWQGNVFLFGSELKALKAHPAFEGEISRGALAEVLKFSYIRAPQSVYRGIRKLVPASYLNMRRADFDTLASPEPTAYWSLCDTVRAGKLERFSGSDGEAIDALESVLRNAIKSQMAADVPLGVFLSGGIDSSTLAALMQEESDRPVRTFTIGFREQRYDESRYAKLVAQRLGTEHTELYVSSRDAQETIPTLPRIYDEPFSDPSQIPTCLLSGLTRRHVTVSLSGDGGDEVFGGYNRHVFINGPWARMKSIPFPIRKNISRGISLLPYGLIAGAGRLLFSGNNEIADKLRKGAAALSEDDPARVYSNLISHWENPREIIDCDDETENPLSMSSMDGIFSGSPVSWFQYMDSTNYLPDDILVKVDRAAMSVSLETRVPYLDPRVVEFAWRLPVSMKFRNGKGKYILRRVLDRYVPSNLVDRPKSGFAIPIDTWLRRGLRDWAESLLSEGRLASEGYFRVAPVRNMWLEHLSGKRNWQYHLWDVLMIQAWLEDVNHAA